MGRPLDCCPQLAVVHRPQQVQAALDQPGELRVRGDVAEAVGAHRDHQQGVLGVRDEGSKEPGSLARRSWHSVITSSHWSTTSTGAGPNGRRPGERIHGVSARRDHDDPVAGSRRRVAAIPARTSDDFPTPDGPITVTTPASVEPSHARRHVRVTTEEDVGVVDVVMDQTRVRASRAGIGGHRHRSKRRVVPQDRLLERDQVGTGIESQLGGEHRAGTMKGAQRVALLAGLVLRQREQRPPTLSQRRLGDPSSASRQHLPVTPGAERRVDAELLSVEAQLLQSRRLGPARAPNPPGRPTPGPARVPAPHRSDRRPAPAPPA